MIPFPHWTLLPSSAYGLNDIEIVWPHIIPNIPYNLVSLQNLQRSFHMHRKLNAFSRMQYDRRMAFNWCRTCEAILSVINCIGGRVYAQLFAIHQIFDLFSYLHHVHNLKQFVILFNWKTLFVLCVHHPHKILCWERTWLSTYYNIEMNMKNGIDDYEAIAVYSVLNTGRSNAIYTLNT